jgi:hypothetical protein
MLFNRVLYNLQRLERLVLEVPLPVCLAGPGGVAETTVRWGNVLGLDFAREETTCERVVDDDVDSVAPAGVDQFRLDRSC